jgi:glycogen debranching enzyme
VLSFAGGEEARVDYEPGESRTGLFGGNSNWRGPVWFTLNHLVVQGLRRFHLGASHQTGWTGLVADILASG